MGFGKLQKNNGKGLKMKSQESDTEKRRKELLAIIQENLGELKDPYPRCLTCSFGIDMGSVNLLRCHKGAPHAYLSASGLLEGGWPIVGKTDFCGHHPNFKSNKANLLLEEIRDLLKEKNGN